MIVFAHAGHWLVQLLYIVPVVFVLGAILYEKRKDRRGDDEAHPDPSGRD